MNLKSVATLCTLGLLACAGAASAHVCAQHAVYGDIDAHYRQLGGEQGPLGCAISDEMDAGNGGRFNQFEHGQIVWSPHQGEHMTVAAWQAGDSIMLRWGPSDPFHYDKFLVHYEHHGLADGVDWAGGTSGSFQLNVSQPGRYSLVVKGCDTHTLSSSTCRQDWTVPVNVDVVDPTGVDGGLRILAEGSEGRGQRLYQPRFFLDAMNAAWNAARGTLCDQIVASASVSDGAGPGYTLRDIVCHLSPRGRLFLDDGAGTRDAIDVVFQVPHNYFEATSTQPTALGSYADPRFSLTYEVSLHARINPATLEMLQADYAVINPSRPDSHNVAADVMMPIDALLQTGVMNRVQAVVQRSGQLDVDAINTQIHAYVGNALAGVEPNWRPTWSIRGGDVVVVLTDPVAKGLRRTETIADGPNAIAPQALETSGPNSSRVRDAIRQASMRPDAASRTGTAVLNPQPLPPKSAATHASAASSKAIIIIGGKAGPARKSMRKVKHRIVPTITAGH